VTGLYRLPLGLDEEDGEVAPHLRTSAYVYVNRGLGTFGLPVRPGVSPEITVRKLLKAGDQPQCLSS
jgi:predicted MPP superfamily phosphohydrolase